MVKKRCENRKKFSRALAATVIDLNGTILARCKLEDISTVGALLHFENEPEGLPKEFLVTLSSNRRVLRRCEHVWTNANKIGVHFSPASQRDFKVVEHPVSSSDAFVLDESKMELPSG